MNNKIYIIATAENKHLIIPYLESLGGDNAKCWDFNDIEIGEYWLVKRHGSIGYYNDTDSIPEEYTEYKLPEQPSELDKAMQMREETLRENASLFLQTEQLKKENEQLRDCLAKGVYAVEVWCKTIEEHVDEYDTQFIQQAKQLLK